MQKVLALLVLTLLAACAAPTAGVSGKRSAATGDEETTATQPRETAGDDDVAPVNPGSPSTSVADEPDPVVDTKELDPFFKAQMETGNIPGVGLAVVRAGKLKWTKGYGLADIAAKKPVGRDTLFMLASVSKTVTAVALMQLVEDKAQGLALDQDISVKLGFQVRHPSFANTPITYRMILTHTSSLIDGEDYSSSPYATGDSPTSLESFAKTAIADEGRWQNARPGTVYEYSNTAIALAGLLVEKITGKNLQVYAKANIFDRLGMKETSFFLRDLDPSHVAIPYNGPTLEPQAHYGYPDYPSGQIRTSAPQLAKFLMILAGGGALGSQRLLADATLAEMMRIQLPSVASAQGLVLYQDTKGGKSVFGHDGADKGVATQMYFNPATKAGYVLLTNTRDQATADAAMARMADKLMELAETLP